MCCVDAPNWKGKYDYYDALKEFVLHYMPSIEILVQGGEILVQKKTLDWIDTLKRENEGLRFSLVTNGNVEKSLIEVVEDLFFCATVSIVGFQEHTYNKIMGMNRARVLDFCEEIIARRKTAIFLKYVTTPIGMHELPLFLEWAILQRPRMIHCLDSNIVRYVRMNTTDHFWDKILERTGRDMQRLLHAHQPLLKDSHIEIMMDRFLRLVLGLDGEFAAANSLESLLLDEETYDYDRTVAAL